MKAKKQYSYELSVEQIETWKARAKRAERDAAKVRAALKNLLPYLGAWAEDFDPSEEQMIAYERARAAADQPGEAAK